MDGGGGWSEERRGFATNARGALVYAELIIVCISVFTIPYGHSLLTTAPFFQFVEVKICSYSSFDSVRLILYEYFNDRTALFKVSWLLLGFGLYLAQNNEWT